MQFLSKTFSEDLEVAKVNRNNEVEHNEYLTRSNESPSEMN